MRKEIETSAQSKTDRLVNFETHKPVEDLKKAAENALNDAKKDCDISSTIFAPLTNRLTQVLAIIDRLHNGNWKEVRDVEALEEVTELYRRSGLIEPGNEHGKHPRVVYSLCLKGSNIEPKVMMSICKDAISYVAIGSTRFNERTQSAASSKLNCLKLNPSLGKKTYRQTRTSRVKYH